ncbi:MAG: polyprenyl synthetase family protein [Thermoanaerobaculia bacterium]|nr:polyprenyl synthetase family protein [Thermoanaerobaculia bacterium]
MSPDLSAPPLGGPASAGFATALEGFRDRFEAELGRWLARRRLEMTGEAPETAELVDRLDPYVLRGGKRVRPAVLYYAYRACGGRGEESVLPAAMAAELLHTYLLIHDDIMDRAETRRGEPAAHRQFSRDHRERGWAGDADHHGLSVAILLGDLAHTYADELFAACDVDEKRRAEAGARFSLMCREVIAGQYLEMTAAQRARATEEDLLRVLRMKSGRYSVQRPMEIGALLAGAPAATLDGLSRLGGLAGEAFQLQDDLLGMFGDRQEVGKPVGGDLVEGKFTLLIFHTLGRCSAEERDAVLAALGNAGARAEEIDRVRGIIRAVGAERQVTGMIDERLREAAGILEGLGLERDGRDFFSGLIEYLRTRRR